MPDRTEHKPRSLGRATATHEAGLERISVILLNA